MLARVLLILAFLASHLAPLALAGARPAPACASATCCVTTETVTCCGERLVEVRCATSGGECRCHVAPADDAPVDRAPATIERDAPVVFVPTRVASIAFVLDESIAAGPAAAASPVCAHADRQALLCIWRT